MCACNAVQHVSVFEICDCRVCFTRGMPVMQKRVRQIKRLTILNRQLCKCGKIELCHGSSRQDAQFGELTAVFKVFMSKVPQSNQEKDRSIRLLPSGEEPIVAIPHRLLVLIPPPPALLRFRHHQQGQRVAIVAGHLGHFGRSLPQSMHLA